jgi:mono/diheme cytochrome c family protein
MARGELMFRGQCMSCHTRDGYRSTRKLLANRDRNGVESILVMLHEQPEDSPYNRFMPPLMGTEEEIAALADYLYADSAEAREAYLEEEGLAEPETAPEEEPEETQQPDPLTTLTPDE